MLKVPAAHLKSMGQITVNFAELETILSFGIWNLIVIPDLKLGQTITAELSFKQKVHLFASLYRRTFNDSLASLELESLLKKIWEAEKKRNVITHSYWGTQNNRSAQTIIRLKMTAKQKHGFTLQTQNMSAEELKRVAQFIDNVKNELMKFLTNRIFSYEHESEKQ